MDAHFQDFRTAYYNRRGDLLASTLSPTPSPHYPTRLEAFYNQTNAWEVNGDIRYYVSKDNSALNIKAAEANSWAEVYIIYWKALGVILALQQQRGGGEQVKLYEIWKEFANALHRGYTHGGFEAWTVPCLYVVSKWLRIFAIRADRESKAEGGGGSLRTDDLLEDGFATGMGNNEKLEDAARVINKVFQLCISDRAPLLESRKWGLYYIINLLFKTYFKLNSISLSKNILRALSASRTEMPALTSFPKSHIVTFKYYVGVIFFLEEDYPQAEENLTEAYNLCNRKSKSNLELVLTYLIPTRMVTAHRLPSQKLLKPYPHLQKLFSPLVTAIRIGNLQAFDQALEAGEPEFVQRRVYLTLERARDICLRNLFRKVFVLGGWEVGKGKEEGKEVRRTRVPLSHFVKAVEVAERKKEGEVEREEVECFLAGMTYKNLIKGYISREAATVVLSKTGAFPGTGV